MFENSVVITDTSCFIILDKISALHILPLLYAKVITTREVAKEYGKTLPDWVSIITVKNETLQTQFSEIVDAGEASAIALAVEMNCDYLLTDDRAARIFAEQMGMKVKGTVGVLLIAKQKGIIPFLRPYIDRIQQTNFRISLLLIDKILREADE